MNNVILTGTLNYLWGLVNCLQIVAFFPLLDVLIPANAKVVFEILIKIATFDLIPVDSIIEVITGLFESTDDFEVPENFTEFDYNSTDPIDNLEFVFLFIVFLIFLPLILLFLRFIGGWNDWIVGKIRKISRTVIYWNFYIRFLLEAYLELS